MLSLQGLLNTPGTTTSGFSESSQSALRWMARLQEEWIIVFDNADSAPEVVEKFIPPGLRGNVLITSRNRSLGRLTHFENSLEIDNMEEEDAISLLLKACGYIGQAETCLWEMARTIVTELCYLPLAVAQAGASIEAGLCNIDDYLLLYSEKRKELLSHPFFKGASEYQQTVYGTWELSFKEIESRASRDSDSDDVQSAQMAIFILQIFAFMHYESIDETIFGNAAEELNMLNNNNKENWFLQILASIAESKILSCNKKSRWDKFHFRKGIQILQSFSLIKKSPCGNLNIYSVHPLIHSWSRDRLSHLEQDINFCRATAILACSIPFSYGTQDYIFRWRLIPHIKAGYQYAAEMEINKKYNDSIYSKFGLVFRENGDWAEAEKLDLQVMTNRMEILGQVHPDTLTSIANLASTYWNQGRWNEAEQLQIQVLDMRKQVLGQTHPDTLTSMSNLALTYSYQGKWNKAEQLQIEVLDMSKRELGEEDPGTLAIIANLALTYSHQGRWNESEQLQIQVLDISKKVLGEEHPDTLNSVANLALVYGYQGRLNEAEQLRIQVLDIRKRVLGPEHPNVLISMACLAYLYIDQRRWNEAEELQIQVLDMSKKVFGLEHPSTLTNIVNLATIYWNQNRNDEAEQLQIQVLDMSKRILGQEHPDTLKSMSNLASTYWNQERYVEAEKLEIQILNIRQRVLGQEHPDTLKSMACLGITHLNQGRLDEAAQLQAQVLDIRKRVLGQEHPTVLINMVNLASIYMIQEKWSEAEQLYIQVLDIQKRVVVQEDPDSLISMANLVTVYKNQGKWSKAEELEIQILNIENKLQ